MTPSPSRYGDGYCTISMATLSPGRAPLAPGSPTEIGSWNVVPSTLTKLVSPASKYVPDENRGGPRQNLDDASLCAQPAAPRRTGDLDGDFVSARGVSGRFRRDVDLVDPAARALAGERNQSLWPRGETAPRSSRTDPAGSASCLAPTCSFPSRIKSLDRRAKFRVIRRSAPRADATWP